MGAQSEAFLEKLGDEWLEFNRPDLGKRDLVTPLLEDKGFFEHKSISVLEIGCSNGWRLKKYQDRGWNVFGLEPSEKAVKEANELLGEGRVCKGTADLIPAAKHSFDLVILGFCLCWVDPEDYPKVVGAIDFVLRSPGYLVIHDICGHSNVLEHVKVQFKDRSPLIFHVTDFLSFWTAFPTYTPICNVLQLNEFAWLLKKSMPIMSERVILED